MRQTAQARRTLLSIKDALSLDHGEYLELYAEHVNSFFVRTTTPLALTRKYVRALGINLWDGEDNCYYDFFSGFGCLNLGHNHPKIVSAIQQGLCSGLPLMHKLSPSPLEAALANNLAALLPEPLQITFFANSGSEAVEAAIKTTRAYTKRSRLLSARNSYHGLTMGALSLTGMDKYQSPFEPLLPFADRVPFGDFEELERRLRSEQYAALFLEPIQGQGGVRVPPPGYLNHARKLCDRYGTLLVLDEIQTGLGRTGTLFAFEYFESVPDLLLLSKSLGGGVMPLAACITTPQIWNRVYGSLKRFLLHSSTFGGNGLACLSGLATLSTLIEDDLCANCRSQGEYLKRELLRLKEKHQVLREIRGMGLMLAVTFDLSGWDPLNSFSRRLIDAISAKIVTSFVASRLLNDYRIVVAPSLTDEYIIRVFPPLIVKKEEIDYFVSSLDQLCSSLSSYTQVLQRTVGSYLAHFARSAGFGEE